MDKHVVFDRVEFDTQYSISDVSIEFESIADDKFVGSIVLYGFLCAVKY